ncbi:MAG: response regulator [Elusimicrobiota bacterium]
MAKNKRRVLAVDDDASVCEYYDHALSLAGYDVECAPSAAEARDALAKRRPDIILMDVMMPDQDGISFTRELRADANTSNIPIIVVSGLADAGTLNDALLFGAVDYMVKPVEIDALKGKIERTFAALERRKKTP